MIDGVDTSRVDPTVDDGEARDTRPRPCRRRTWCTLDEHADDVACVEIPRAAIEPGEYGPRRRWGR